MKSHYLWLGDGHPSIASNTTKLPVPKPYTRAPIPAVKFEPNIKKRIPRKTKHKKLPIA